MRTLRTCWGGSKREKEGALILYQTRKAAEEECRPQHILLLPPLFLPGLVTNLGAFLALVLA